MIPSSVRIFGLAELLRGVVSAPRRQVRDRF